MRYQPLDVATPQSRAEMVALKKTAGERIFAAGLARQDSMKRLRVEAIRERQRIHNEARAAEETARQQRATVVFISQGIAGEIISAVCTVGKLRRSELLSPARVQRIVYWRQIAMLLIKRHSSKSDSAIGRIFQRDHTTVIHGIRRATFRGKTADIAAVEAML